MKTSSGYWQRHLVLGSVFNRPSSQRTALTREPGRTVTVQETRGRHSCPMLVRILKSFHGCVLTAKKSIVIAANAHDYVGILWPELVGLHGGS